jgi:hypothetical protein
VENSWLPSKHLEFTARAAVQSESRLALPPYPRQPVDSQDLAVVWLRKDSGAAPAILRWQQGGLNPTPDPRWRS